MQFDVAIVGAGAAGLHCAAIAGQLGCAVVLIDHAEKVAEKIRISGGGRCNFTNLDVGAAALRFGEPRLLPLGAGALHAARLHRAGRAPRHRLAREAPRASCSATTRARAIIDMLLAECDAGAVQRWQPCRVDGVRTRRRPASSSTRRAGRLAARRLVVATGGLSIPKIGASDWGYVLARRLGHRIVEPRPALVPLRLRRRRVAAVRGAWPACRCRCAIAAGSGAAPRRVRRGPALHASRPERPGGAAGLDLLAARRGDRRSTSRRAPTSAAALVEAKSGRAPRSAPCSPSSCRGGSPRPGWRRRRCADRPLADLRDRDLAALAARAAPLDADADRHRGLPQGRGHGRRRRHPRARFAQLRKPPRARPALHRRGRRRDRLAGRLQLPVGLGQRGRLRPGAGGGLPAPGVRGL